MQLMVGKIGRGDEKIERLPSTPSPRQRGTHFLDAGNKGDLNFFFEIIDEGSLQIKNFSSYPKFASLDVPGEGVEKENALIKRNRKRRTTICITRIFGRRNELRKSMMKTEACRWKYVLCAKGLNGYPSDDKILS
jgi:hypothetical protein